MDWDRDIELIFIQFKDVPVAYSVELCSKDETVDDIKENLRKEYPNGRHILPQETLVYKNQQLKDGDQLANYRLPKNALLHVVERNTTPSSPEILKVKEEGRPWDLGVIQSVKQGQLQPVDLLTMDEPFYNNPFIKPKPMYVNPNSASSTNLSGVRRKMIAEDERTGVCDKRARMSSLPNGVGSKAIQLGRGEFSQQPSADERIRLCDQRDRMSPLPSGVGSQAGELGRGEFSPKPSEAERTRVCDQRARMMSPLRSGVRLHASELGRGEFSPGPSEAERTRVCALRAPMMAPLHSGIRPHASEQGRGEFSPRPFGDERTRVCDERSRMMSPLSNGVGSHAMELGRAVKFSPQPSAGVAMKRKYKLDDFC